MLDLFQSIPVLLAANDPAPGAGGSESMLPMLMTFLPLVILFYFLILRPQQNQARKLKEMIGALKKNDRVLTSAGIFGTVVSIDDAAERVILRVDDDKGIKLAFLKSSVVRVIDPSSEKSAETA